MTTESIIRWVEVGKLGDIEEGQMAGVDVDGEPILLIHSPEGTIQAFQGMCPHQEQRLAEGFLDDGVLTCAGHLWEFDAHSGEAIDPETSQLYRYLVKIEDNAIVVGIPQDNEAHYNRGIDQP